ncbi:unnamed protein product [Amoebophrya sp. A120]|nr:unnamed protein product [Amoebophrya sp. A120]|eukprot:GSA120T00007301001.1
MMSSFPYVLEMAGADAGSKEITQMKITPAPGDDCDVLGDVDEIKELAPAHPTLDLVVMCSRARFQAQPLHSDGDHQRRLQPISHFSRVVFLTTSFFGTPAGLGFPLLLRWR